MRRLLLPFALVGFAGCVYEWNGRAPVLQLSGTAPSLDALERLNTRPAGLAQPMTGADGAPWVAFCEFDAGEGESFGPRGCKREHLVRLGAPVQGTAGDEVILADAFDVHDHTLYVSRDEAQATLRGITLHRPGQPATDDVTFHFRAGRPLIVANDDGESDVFAYLVLDPSTDHFDVLRRDRRHARAIPLPAGVDASALDEQPGFDLRFTTDGSVLVVRGPDGTTTAHATLDDTSIDLGKRPVDFFLDSPRRALLTVGSDGLRSVPLDGGAERVLATASFNAASLVVKDGAAWYPDGANLYRVALDGSGPPALVQANAARLIAIGPHGEIAYSRDAGDRYVGGAGDGWLADWSFMQRGQLVTWNAPGSRLHFLEHAATIDTVGDLISAAIPNGAPQKLALNVHDFQELGDGRVVVLENHVYEGTWNRLVVVDETAGTKRWVTPATAQFLLVPRSSEVIADVISGASGYDIVRMPIPAR